MTRPVIQALVLLACLASAGRAATVTFEADQVLLGTKWGEAFGNFVGEPVLMTQDGIVMSVGNYVLEGFIAFDKAEVGDPRGAGFPTTPLDLDAISVMFDFSGVGFDVNEVTLEFREFGPADSGHMFAVNGNLLDPLPSFADIPTNVAPGVTAFVTDTTITLSGDITSLLIGGQEVAIDTIVAIPEPTTVLLLGVASVSLLCRRREGRRRTSPTVFRDR